VRCSGGTYVRTLAHDLGQALGVGGALAALRRTRSEPFSVEGAVSLRDLDAGADEVLARAGLLLDAALAVLPAVSLDAAQAEEIGHGGRPLVDPGDAPLAAGERSVVLRGAGGRALALGSLEPDAADPARVRAWPQVVFPWAVRTGRA
jgi:tRNA U55 pseudouridine synthase TruB